MKLLASDFDDTLFHHPSGILPEDEEAIKKFQKEGNLFGICTGRGPNLKFDMEKMMDKKIHPDFYILSNGACVVDFQGNPLQEKFLPKRVIWKIFDMYPAVHFFVHTKKEGFYRDIPSLLMAEGDINWDEVYAISYHFSEEGTQGMLEQISEISEADCLVNSQTCDIVAHGVRKGTGVQDFVKLNQLDCDCIMCIGDSWNDVSMIESADIGFTFHASPKGVQDKADYVVDSIAQALQAVGEI